MWSFVVFAFMLVACYLAYWHDPWAWLFIGLGLLIPIGLARQAYQKFRGR
jgi:hypothetical protein